MYEDAKRIGVPKGEDVMEKKTMGAFISALRRAKGMTQRELGEQLFVSDKTVSRWERDECTPDLSLIPLIADLFGVTADELLRGERKNTDTNEQKAENEADAARVAQKSERRFRALLKQQYTRYRNLSVISVGIALLGVVVAAIIDLGFLRAHVGFWVAAALMLCAVVCQLCFFGNARVSPEIDDEDAAPWHRDAVRAHNLDCLMTAKNVCMLVFLLFAFCLPLATLVSDAHWGLEFGSWLLWGMAFSSVALIVAHSVWQLAIRKHLIDRGLLALTQTAAQGYTLERRLLGRTLALLLVGGVVTLMGCGIVQGIDVTKFAPYHTFETQEDFIAFAESDEPAYSVTSIGWPFDFVIEHSVPVQEAPLDSVDNADGEMTDDEVEYPRAEFYGRDGKVLFTYVAKRSFARIGLSDTEDGFPVRAYTSDQLRVGYTQRENVYIMCILTYGAFGAVTVAVYVKRLSDLRKKYR